MKFLLTLLAFLALAAAPAQAQCQNCGCKEKCSRQCTCQHDEKPQPR